MVRLWMGARSCCWGCRGGCAPGYPRTRMPSVPATALSPLVLKGVWTQMNRLPRALSPSILWVSQELFEAAGQAAVAGDARSPSASPGSAAIQPCWHRNHSSSAMASLLSTAW